MTEPSGTAPALTRVGVVGCGLMGAGLAEVCAKPGRTVLVAVSSDRSLAAGRTRVTSSVNRAVAKGKLSMAARDEILGRITFSTDLHDLADRELVIEAVSEDEPTKLKLFAQLDSIVRDPEAVLASNTSSLSIAKLATATERPGQVVGMHFFNPVPALPLVEITGSLLTEERTLARAETFVRDVLGKDVIRSRDRAGFVVNALLVPYLLSAIRMLESGHATAEDIDKGMVLGCAHPMGPLRLADLVGLDTLAAVAAGLYEETKEPLYVTPALLTRMVESGLFGKKSGRGFYDYRPEVRSAPLRDNV
ncbi:MAG TPA: 3-hydroxybutyryl-CoA dehydrogenase [Actinophytocola sp.]|uniref:3-hydroxybutyryl-CoA dehydrogenase n=1 Tax=Actinophytocola sp. TaxID=1872138 RepID=UPI002DB90AB7|nr:3-hydroxybutyryl-CoA dehydrogenase [Actinophytocola sp.]HEU5474636.1 3-hydroxybutyryl-CoA dehydrogenase [Actinophytocola sp.]